MYSLTLDTCQPAEQSFNGVMNGNMINNAKMKIVADCGIIKHKLADMMFTQLLC